MAAYQVSVNEKELSEIEISGKGIAVNGNSVDWDLIETGHNRFHVLINHHSHSCEVISSDAVKKNLSIRVNGKVIQVTVRDRFDELLRRLGMDKVATNKINVIKAPMPGLVIKLMVQEGQEIK